jgi:hypothetical protein
MYLGRKWAFIVLAQTVFSIVCVLFDIHRLIVITLPINGTTAQSVGSLFSYQQAKEFMII